MIGPQRNHVVEVGRTVAGVFAPWRELMARVTVIRGKEQLIRDQRVAETVYSCNFDFFDVEDVTQEFAMRFEGIMLDIKQIRPDYVNKKETVIEAVEVGTRQEVEPEPGDPDQPPPAPGPGQGW